MSNTAIEINSSNFAEITNSGITLVDFWAPWCGPCRMLTPVIEKIAAAYADKVTVGKVDIDKEPSLATQFQVQSVPTVLLMKDGEVKKIWIGVQSFNIFDEAIKSII